MFGTISLADAAVFATIAATIIASVTPFLTVFAAMVGVVAVNNTTRAAIGVTGEVPETIASKVTKAILPKRK